MGVDADTADLVEETLLECGDIGRAGAVDGYGNQRGQRQLVENRRLAQPGLEQFQRFGPVDPSRCQHARRCGENGQRLVGLRIEVGA